MANVIKLRKGLDINLKGTACKETISTLKSGEYALVPDSFCGVIPKVVVHEGDKVKAGETIQSISKKRGVSIDKICQLNHLSSKSHVRPGQILRYS